jgi:serine/threonine protein kinase
MDSWRLNTTHGKMLGSPQYMSPEQVSSRTIDHRSDIFSVGTLMYRMLSGKMPFTGNNTHAITYKIVNEDPQKLSSLNPTIPDMLNAIVSKCLSKNPDERYQSASELADALRVCQENMLRTDTGRAQTPVGKFSPSAIRILSILGILALVIIVFELIEEFLLD